MTLKETARAITEELSVKAKLKKGDIFVLGCSTSEIAGKTIGTDSNENVAKEVFDGIYGVLKEKGVYLAVQCCEHLNRAIVIERSAIGSADTVNVVPQKKAGGSMATVAYSEFNDPVVVEKIRADAGLDIGGTLIGMHLKEVAVPVRLTLSKLGEANIVCARTRPKFIGGARAVYDQNLL